jgi:hypothetical protein
MFFKTLVAMNYSCKTFVKTNLAPLHYVTFIEPLAVCSTDVLSFDSNEFMNNGGYHAHQRTFLHSFFGVKKPFKFETEVLSHEVF